MRKTLISLTTVLAMAIPVCLYILGDARRENALATDNLKACKDIVNRIKSLQDKPPMAAMQAQSDSQLAQRIEAAASKAKFDASKVARIEPESRRRIGKSQYEEQPTFVELYDVTIPELGGFLDAILAEEYVANIRSLRLISPRKGEDASDDEQWTVEMTLTNLIYAPKS